MPLVARAVTVSRNGWMPRFSGIPYPRGLNYYVKVKLDTVSESKKGLLFIESVKCEWYR
jgi:hypothetical protein